MTPQERDVLLPLLDRLRQTRVADKDAEADQMIRQAVMAQPDAPYVLAQTVLMQDYALHAAQDRIHALEQQLAAQQSSGQHASGGGFLSGLLGGRSAAPAPAPPPQYARPSYGAQIANAVQPGGGAPSFLRSAAQTAAGVAGGALLVQGLEGLFGGHGGLGGLGGTFGGASGLLGGAGGGFAPMQGVDDRRAIDDQPLPLPDDQSSFQGGDPGYGSDQSDADTGGSSYADDVGGAGGDIGGSADAGDDFASGDFGSGDYGSGDYGGDDSLNS